MAKFDARSATGKCATATEDLRDLALQFREIAFIDADIGDIDTLREGMRSDIEQVVLSRAKPAMTQIVDALAERHALDAVHIVAHGRPGALYFASETVTLETIERHATTLWQIGASLGTAGAVLLWSCNLAEGAPGAAFVERLAQAANARVLASSAPIGAAALGGRWSLDQDLEGLLPPLSATGQEHYAGVLIKHLIDPAVALTMPPSIHIDPIDDDDAIGYAQAHADVPITGSTTGMVDGTILTILLTEGNIQKSYTATVQSSVWSTTISSADALSLPNGLATVTATGVAHGNVISAPQQTVHVVETLPTFTVGTVAGDDAVNNAEAHAGGGVALTGSVTGLAAGATFIVTIVDGSFKNSYVATVNGSGTGWTATIPSVDALKLTDGTATISAAVYDQFGNNSGVLTHTVQVHETIATATIGTVAGDNNINYAEAHAAGGIQLSGTVTGLAAGVTFGVMVSDNGVSHTYTATVNGAGTGWTATIPMVDAAQLDNGTATVSATTDQWGNAVTATARVVDVQMGPRVTVGLTTDTGSSATDKITSNDALTGSGDANAIVHFTIDGVASATTATANASGAWTFTPTGLANGQHTIVASETDAAGNTGTSPLTFTFDTTPPLVTITSAGGSTTQASQTVTGTVADISAVGTTVTLFRGTTQVGTATVQANGSWSSSITLANGVNHITAVDTDAAGNIGTSTAVTYTLGNPNAPAHIVVVMDENQSFNDLIGNPLAPFLNSLAAGGMVYASFNAETHPSQPNYLALFSGSTQGVTDDGSYSFPTTPSLAGELLQAGYGFTGYTENGAVNYHSPWLSFGDAAATNANFSTFPTDFSQLPTVSFINPSLMHDMTDDSGLTEEPGNFRRRSMVERQSRRLCPVGRQQQQPADLHHRRGQRRR